MATQMLLLAGAGASRCLGFPVCCEFFAQPETRVLLKYPLLRDILKAPQSSEDDERADLEEVMNVTAALAGVEPGRNRPSSTGAYLDLLLKRMSKLSMKYAVGRGKEPAPSGSYSGGYAPPREEEPPFVASPDAFKEIDLRLREAVIDVYSVDITTENIAPTADLLKALVSEAEGRRLAVFTTNYDRVFETAVGSIGTLYDGFRLHGDLMMWGKANYAPFYEDMGSGSGEASGASFALYKLHGSVDWAWRPMSGNVSVARDTGARKADLAKHVVLFPAFKGVPDSEVFLHGHLALRRALTRAAVCVSVGFSYRDDYLNSIVYDAMADNPKLRLLLVDPVDSAISDIKRRLTLVGINPNRISFVKAALESSGTVAEVMESLKTLHGNPGDAAEDY